MPAPRFFLATRFFLQEDLLPTAINPSGLLRYDYYRLMADG
jgi:hypothetical protein